MVGHILKTHIPMDRAPFYCTLCSFRCQDRDTLAAHIKKYRRHRDEEVKSGTPDYTQVLKKAANPIYVGDSDMVVLSKEESLRWHARHKMNQEDPLNDPYGLFADDDETTVVDGLVMPQWIAPSRQASTTIQPDFGRQPPQSGSTAPLPVVPSAKPLRSEYTNLIGPMGTFKSQSQKTSDLVTIVAGDQASIFGRINTPTTPVQPTLDTVGHLSTPALRRRSFGSTSTPCLDERGTEDLLPGLLSLNQNDPLLREAQDVTKGPSMTSIQTQTDVDDSTEEPVKKRPRLEEETSQVVITLQAIASATVEGMMNIVEAINGNTRAIRHQEKTQERIVSELARIERKITLMERSRNKENSPSNENRTTNKGNENKQFKSIVKKA